MLGLSIQQFGWSKHMLKFKGQNPQVSRGFLRHLDSAILYLRILGLRIDRSRYPRNVVYEHLDLWTCICGWTNTTPCSRDA